MKKAAIYARFSSDNQRDESIDAQVRAIEAYAERNGYEIVKEYKDKAKSATTDRRPGFQKMIKESALGLFEVVIVHKLDRFSRDRYDSATYKRKLKANGVRLLSVTENLDGSPESIMLESLLEGMAEYYSKNLAREVMKGMLESAHKCKHTGGIPPLGYDVDKEKKYVINEKEAIIIREIFEMFINGHTYIDMVNHLNQQGYRTKRGGEFRKSSLHDIIRNEKYAGVYVFNRSASKDAFGKRNNHKSKSEEEIIKIEGGVPAIVSEETFSKAMEMMEIRKRSPGARKAKESYLLQGITVCGECGSRFEGNRRKSMKKSLFVSYRCGSRHANICCDNKEVKKETIEEFVLEELERKILNDKAIEKLTKKINEYLEEKTSTDRIELRKMEQELKEVEKKIGNIVKAISDGFYQEEFKQDMEKHSKRKSEIKNYIATLKANEIQTNLNEMQIRSLFKNFKKFVMERNLPECKTIIHNYVEQVVVYKDHIEVIFNVASLVLGDVDGLRITSKRQRGGLKNRHLKNRAQYKNTVLTEGITSKISVG